MKTEQDNIMGVRQWTQAHSCVFFPLRTSSRVKKSGGFITWNSLGQPNVNGRLAMTRSIGDFDLKKMGVIAEPETKRITVSL